MYKCIRDFNVETCDEDGFPTDKFFVIKSGTEWERNNYTNIIGGDVHLDSVDDSRWIEISYDTLKDYFIESEE